MIPFEGTYTRKEWAAGIRIAMHPRGRGLVMRLVGAGLVLGGIAIIAGLLLTGEALSTARLVRLAITLSFLAYWTATPYVRAWRATSGPWRGAARGPSLKGAVTAEGIATNASASEPIEKWPTFLRAVVRPDLVVLIGSSGMATILPRTFFSHDADWQAFVQLVEMNIVPL